MDNQTAPAGKQVKGIKKLWLKVKASMKNDTPSSSSKPTSSATTTPSKPTSDPAPAAAQKPTIATTEPVDTPKVEKTTEEAKPTAVPIMSNNMIEVDEEDDVDEKVQVPQIKAVSAAPTDKEATAQRYQRAQEVFQKYGLTMEPMDWQQPNNPNVERIEKKPRMRVRYSCHECKETFGREKTCPSCTHTRCDSCVRYPPKKAGDKVKRTKKVQAIPTTMAAPTTGACHECKTTFDLGAKSCGNCDHQICSRCLQETVNASPATAPPPAQPIAVAAAS